MTKPKIAVDFDHTIAQHDGDYDEDDGGYPIKGSKEFLTALNLLGYEVWIFSARASDEHGTNVIRKWLDKYRMTPLITGITNVKSSEFVSFVDDRAVPFEGDYNQTLNWLLGAQH